MALNKLWMHCVCGESKSLLACDGSETWYVVSKDNANVWLLEHKSCKGNLHCGVYIQFELELPPTQADKEEIERLRQGHRTNAPRRYDIVYKHNSAKVESHFCRENDCFGTNPDRGFTFEEAKAEVSSFYHNLADRWASITEEELFLEEEK